MQPLPSNPEEAIAELQALLAVTLHKADMYDRIQARGRERHARKMREDPFYRAKHRERESAKKKRRHRVRYDTDPVYREHHIQRSLAWEQRQPGAYQESLRCYRRAYAEVWHQVGNSTIQTRLRCITEGAAAQRRSLEGLPYESPVVYLCRHCGKRLPSGLKTYCSPECLNPPRLGPEKPVRTAEDIKAYDRERQRAKRATWTPEQWAHHTAVSQAARRRRLDRTQQMPQNA